MRDEKFDYEKRIADYRASTDQKALEWRAAVLGMDERAQKRAYFRFMVADGRMAEAVHSIVDIAVEGWPVMMQGNHVVHGTSVISTAVPDTSRKWILIASARIEKRKRTSTCRVSPS